MTNLAERQQFAAVPRSRRYHVTYWGRESVQIQCYSRAAYTEAIRALATLAEWKDVRPASQPGYECVRMLSVALGL